MKEYFIHVNFIPNINRVRVQLKDANGTRPGAKPPGYATPARVYVRYYKSAVQGVRHFTRYREDLERRMN